MQLTELAKLFSIFETRLTPLCVRCELISSVARDKLGTGVINRMMNRKLSMAWEKWKHEAAEMKAQARLLAGARTQQIYHWL